MKKINNQIIELDKSKDTVYPKNYSIAIGNSLDLQYALKIIFNKELEDTQITTREVTKKVEFADHKNNFDCNIIYKI